MLGNGKRRDETRLRSYGVASKLVPPHVAGNSKTKPSLGCLLSLQQDRLGQLQIVLVSDFEVHVRIRN
jgi:hypothetical protein